MAAIRIERNFHHHPDVSLALYFCFSGGESQPLLFFFIPNDSPHEQNYLQMQLRAQYPPLHE